MSRSDGGKYADEICSDIGLETPWQATSYFSCRRRSITLTDCLSPLVTGCYHLKPRNYFLQQQLQLKNRTQLYQLYFTLTHSHTDTLPSIHSLTHTHTHTHSHTHTHTDTPTHTLPSIHTLTHTHTHTQSHSHTHTVTLTLTLTHTHTHSHSHTHSHTHT